MKLTPENYLYRTYNVEYFIDVNQQCEKSPSMEKIINNSDIQDTLTKMRESLAKIRTIEKNIRNIDPNFQFPIRAIYYPRIGV